MVNWKIEIALVSDAIIGSGESWGAIIDTDVVFDRCGLPYIPGRRVRGVLRESVTEILEMLYQARLLHEFDIQGTLNINTWLFEIFGKPGQDEAKPLSISDCRLKDYNTVADHLRYLQHEHPDLFTPEVVRNHYSVIRQQTAIDSNGIAVDKSLRTVRALMRGLVFEGNFKIVGNVREKLVLLMGLAISNMRHIGTSRTRGFGEIKASLKEKLKNNWVDVLSQRKKTLKWEAANEKTEAIIYA